MAPAVPLICHIAKVGGAGGRFGDDHLHCVWNGVALCNFRRRQCEEKPDPTPKPGSLHIAWAFAFASVIPRLLSSEVCVCVQPAAVTCVFDM